METKKKHSSAHPLSPHRVISLLSISFLLFVLLYKTPVFGVFLHVQAEASAATAENSINSPSRIWRKHPQSSSFHFDGSVVSPLLLLQSSHSNSQAELSTRNRHRHTGRSSLSRRFNFKQAEEISLLQDEQEDNSDDDGDGGGSTGLGLTTNTNTGSSMNNETTMSRKTKENVMMMDMDQIMNDIGAWNFQKDQPSPISTNNNGTEGLGGHSYKTTYDSTLSTVKIIPDEHHVSAFLNKGIVKRFLFLNNKFGNPLSITITPCTSILLWNVKFWHFSENGTEPVEHVKTYRTQRTVTFTEGSARRGVYSIDIRPLHWDSYVHLYATSFNAEPIRVLPFQGEENIYNTHQKSSFFTDNNDKFYQHIFTQAETENNNIENNRGTETEDNNPFNIPFTNDFQTNTNLDNNLAEETPKTSTMTNKPRIWVRRLRGNRLQVKWDTSPINPHLMNYCIVVNTRRDYSSLCSASGERFGVLPPDLMHVAYYGENNNDLIMIDKDSNAFHNIKNYPADSPSSKTSPSRANKSKGHKHRHQHGSEKTSYRGTRATNEDIIIGCVNKKTNYILSNLQQGRLYYFNVFIRDLSTNVSYPYVRTTLKYQTPKHSPNTLRDAKATKVKLSDDTGKASKPTVVKFNLNKPCAELTMYVMPCGGGSIVYEAFHGNRSVYRSSAVDSLDIIKIGMPQKGKYFIKISQPLEAIGQQSARMTEVYIGKKNKKFPLPKMPAITKITEDESARNCDSVTIQWWPSPDSRDNEYCIFLKEENRKRIFQFKKPNQCDVERSLKSDPYITHSLCIQRTLTPDMMLLTQNIVGLQPSKTYVVQVIVRRHNGKSLSYDLHFVKTTEKCSEN